MCLLELLLPVVLVTCISNTFSVAVFSSSFLLLEIRNSAKINIQISVESCGYTFLFVY